MRKRVLCLVLIISSFVSLCACSSTKDTPGDNENKEAVTSDAGGMDKDTELTGNKQVYDKYSMNSDETAMLVLTALQNGSMETILDLCAIDEFIDSEYTITDIHRNGGNRALVEYEIPYLSGMTKSVLAHLVRADYASGLEKNLYTIVSETDDTDYTAIDLNNRFALPAEQAVSYEKALEDFDFTGIRVEFLVRAGIDDAIDRGWIAEDYADLCELMPFLTEFDMVDTCATEWTVYHAIISYEGRNYMLSIPLFRYKEGWRIQKAYGDNSIRIEPLETELEAAISELGSFASLAYSESSYKLLQTSGLSASLSTEDDVIDYVVDLFVSSNIADLGVAAQPEQYMADVDTYDWFYGDPTVNLNSLGTPQMLGGWVSIMGLPFPTAVPGFSALSRDIFLGCSNQYASILWYMANRYAAGHLFGIYGDSYVTPLYNAVIGGDGRMVGIVSADATEGERLSYRENFPTDLVADYFDEINNYWDALARPVAVSEMPEDSIPERMYTFYGGQPSVYLVAFDLGDEGCTSFSLVIAPCGNGFRLADISMTLRGGITDGKSPEDTINEMREILGNVRDLRDLA